MLAVVEDEQLGTTLRVAGGWVRDKVLGHWSADGKVDIDIALDNMMGSEFAATLNRWLAKRGRQVYNVGIISANPEKSKHLETATMRVGSFWIDFVNLRTEAYTDESRIPSMNIGSPQEDALRQAGRKERRGRKGVRGRLVSCFWAHKSRSVHVRSHPSLPPSLPPLSLPLDVT